MANLQYTRFNKIYPNREAAIDILKGLSRLYAETVAIKYLNSEDKVVMILATYISVKLGDFIITFDPENDISQVEENSREIQKLKGEGEGSIKNTISNAISLLMGNNVSEDFNTLSKLEEKIKLLGQSNVTEISAGEGIKVESDEIGRYIISSESEINDEVVSDKSTYSSEFIRNLFSGGSGVELEDDSENIRINIKTDKTSICLNDQNELMVVKIDGGDY